MKPNKKPIRVPLGACVMLILLTAALTFCLTTLFSPGGFSLSLSGDKLFSKLREIDWIARRYAYQQPDREALADQAAAGYLAALDDRYAAYLTAEDYADVSLSYEGKGIGVGVTVTEHPDTGYLYVVSAAPDSPAGEAGLRRGDQITAVDGQDVLALGYDGAVAAIQGEIGTELTLTVLREGESLTVPLTRREYTASSVESRMIGKTGYVRVTTFNDGTPAQFQAAVTALQEQGAEGLLFDLRRNTGGTLDSVAAMLDFLLPEGDIVSATYRDGSREVLYRSGASEVDLPMAVLTDHLTASASELFSAAIRDTGKGKLVGSTTYGKGVMQRTFELSDGSAVRVTTALFNPPSGVNFNGEGLVPDVEVAMTEEQSARLYLLEDWEDPVLQAGLEVLGDRLPER